MAAGSRKGKTDPLGSGEEGAAAQRKKDKRKKEKNNNNKKKKKEKEKKEEDKKEKKLKKGEGRSGPGWQFASRAARLPPSMVMC